jgi:HAD superfamily hydrolase (TIGR01509 family)
LIKNIIGKHRKEQIVAEFQYGAIFDMDGVLIDNAEYHILAFKEWCAEMGVPFDQAYFEKYLFGKQNKDIFKTLLKREITPEELEIWDLQKEQLYRDLYTPHVKEVPGLKRYLEDLVAHGFGNAVATSGSIRNVKFILGKLGVEELFQASVTQEDITKGKPDPQVFLTAMNRLNLPDSQCAVFEDSVSGAKAAVASGACLIGVATGHKLLDGASKMICNFNEISVEETISLITNHK